MHVHTFVCALTYKCTQVYRHHTHAIHTDRDKGGEERRQGKKGKHRGGERKMRREGRGRRER